MSGIAGIYNLDGAPVDPTVLQRMAAAAAHRGPDGIDYWVDGNVGFAHLALNTTPESLRERQPLRSRDGRLCLTADARVDNRAELISTLTSKGVYLEDPTDADLILAAYEVWGADCLKEIIGDFAFVIWDGRERRLFLVRDPMGIRPLFYCRRGQTLFFASAISSIIAGLGERPALNEPLVVDFLCWWFDRWVHETVYEAVYRVPSSHYLEVWSDGEHLARHWVFGSQPSPQYTTDEDYVEHFRELFGEAVRCRLRSSTPVGLQVGGGVDSSSIACLLHHMLAEGEASSQHQVQLYSWVFKDFPEADEREFLDAVIDACKEFPATCIAGETFWGFKGLGEEGAYRGDEPEISPLTNMTTSLLRVARSQGCRIVLTGEGGDQVMNRAAYWTPYLMGDISFWQLGAELQYFWCRRRWAVVVALLRRLIAPLLKPLVPARFLALRQWRRQRSFRIRSTPAWVFRDKISFSNEAEFGRTVDRAAQLPSLSAAVIWRDLTDGQYVAILGYLEAVAAFAGMELRFPYLDRRVVDFFLSVPPRLLFAHGLAKLLLRRAMAGILVEQVRQRITHAHFQGVINYGICMKEEGKVRLLLEGVAADQGQYLNVERLRTAWQEHCRGDGFSSRQLLAPLLFQVWLQGFPVSVS